MVFTMILVESAVEVDLFFLKNEDLNVPMTNSYFCCNVRNSGTLTWEINGEGIGGFNGLKDVIAGTFSTYTYFASLLSMRNNSGQYTLDSVLIVTAPTGSTVNVHCITNEGVETISNQADPLNTENNEPIRNGTVNMQPVFLTNSIIVSDGRNISTKAFLCDSINTVDLSWETNTSSNTTNELALNSSSGIGISDFKLTDKGDTVRLQAMSLGKQQQRFYSILYVTDNTFKAVRCLAGGRAVEYSAVQIKFDKTTTTFHQGMHEGVGGKGGEEIYKYIKSIEESLSLYTY